MKIIHTADWHIGQNFFGFDRKVEHDIFLTWLSRQIKDHDVDVLLISGDVFDSPNPSAESQRLFYHFLRKITTAQPELQVIITAGNHDSAARLEAPMPLLETMNVWVKGIVPHTAEGKIDYASLIVPLSKGGYCLAVPFLRQGDYENAETMDEGIRQFYNQLLQAVPDKHQPIIAMGHLHALSGDTLDDDRSERELLGGLDAVSANEFAHNFTYTALGHLHKHQSIGAPNVMYSGTPLPMSFSEIKYTPGVVLVTIEDGTATPEHLPFDVPVKLISVPSQPAPVNEVLEAIEALPDGEVTDLSPFLEVRVRLDGPEPALRYRIEEALNGKNVRLTSIKTPMVKTAESSERLSFTEFKEKKPFDLAQDVYCKRYGVEKMPEELEELFNQVEQQIKVNA